MIKKPEIMALIAEQNSGDGGGYFIPWWMDMNREELEQAVIDHDKLLADLGIKSW